MISEDIRVRVPDAAYPKPAVAWYAVVVLAVLYWVAILDRFVIALLIDPIKRDLGLSDVQFGMLQGTAFAVTFAFFGLLAGVAADRLNRRWIIFASVSIWSVATAACGLAQNFWHMLVARVGVGAGEAGLNPCATSMITDLVPRERLTSAMAVYTIGATVGTGCAYLFGGVIVQAISALPVVPLPLLGEVRPWQAVFFGVGIPGALLSLLIFTIAEPARRGGRSSQAGAALWRGYAELFGFVRAHGKFFACHYGGFALGSMAMAGAGIWYPAHMARSFGWSPGKIGLTLGLMLVIAGTISKLLSGYCVDALYRKGVLDAQLRWFSCCLLAAAPVGVIATTSDDPWVFVGGVGLFLTLLSALPAVASAALNLVTPNELRGAGAAVFGSFSGLVGSGAGPVLIAMAAKLYADDGAIGHGIATLIAICCPLGALTLFLGLRAMREAMTEAEGRHRIGLPR